MKYLFFLAAVLTLASCSDLHKKDQIAEIDQMNNTLDSIQEVLFKNEIDTIAALRVATNSVEIRIKNYYYADTIDMALGKKMDAYKVMRRDLGPLGRSFNAIKKGVTEQKKSLNNLKTDIENGDGERKKYDEYIAFEKDKTHQLQSLLKE